MAQADLLKILEKNIKQIEKTILNITKEEEVMDELWKVAISRQDFINVLGISMKSVSHGLAKLHLQDKVLKLRDEEKDKRRIKYVYKLKSINNMVDNGSNK